LLPSLMLHMELVTLWDLVRLKLGAEPSYGIPLFKGLSRTQVHYIIMAGSLRRMDQGEVLFYRGEPSDSMYAIVSGTLDVFEHTTEVRALESATDLKRINRLDVGEIVGEMGLVRSAPRSATVVAASPAELLKINWKMIQRLQWLYPPTANRFFFNLMSILCDRLERASICLFEDSRVDDLTGLLNRRAFAQILESEVYRARHYGFPLSLCLAGIELEKPSGIGGFDTGDQQIHRVASVLAAAVRKCEVLSRLDTHTFALLLPHISEESARRECNRLTNLINSAAGEDGRIPRIFFGIAGLDGSADEGGNALLSRAADALAATAGTRPQHKITP